MSADEVETGIGPVFALDEMRVRCVSVVIWLDIRVHERKCDVTGTKRISRNRLPRVSFELLNVPVLISHDEQSCRDAFNFPRIQYMSAPAYCTRVYNGFNRVPNIESALRLKRVKCSAEFDRCHLVSCFGFYF